MKIKKVLVTGNVGFLRRYQFLFEAMSSHFEKLECLPSGNFHQTKLVDLLARGFYKTTNTISPITASRFLKNERTYIIRSRQTERKIRQLPYKPDLIFHAFGMFSPLWDRFDLPYVMYLDYTMALAKKNWSSWAPFPNDEAFSAWANCEKTAYEQARHLFVMGSVTKHSLIQDYGIEPKKITVVGSSGNFKKPYQGEKTFGNKQILFNGSDFQRKGGDLVLSAFEMVKKAIPEAKLVLIGKKIDLQQDGVVNPGAISSLEEMRNLFLKTDLVVAPSRCEPFQEFLLEAINYGVPCLVSGVDGMPEIIDNEIDGIVTKQPTPAILAEQTIDLLKNSARLTSMSQKARHKTKTKWNWDGIAANISQVLSTLN
ncbi:MAG: glycosyltransferase family 4 protein [Xenococcaceae cyanobacterium]